jgi:hypothetical protein
MDRGITESRARRVVGNVLIVLTGFPVGASAILKFARVPGVVNQMAALGFADGKLILVATLELLSATLFLFPRTRSVGMFLFSAFFGGAICTHVQLGEFAKAVSPSIMLGLAWLGTWLRNPEVLWSFTARPRQSVLIADSKTQHLVSGSA